MARTVRQLRAIRDWAREVWVLASGTWYETAASGLEAVRGASARLTLLASGMLAGVADALRDQNQTKKGN